MQQVRVPTEANTGNPKTRGLTTTALLALLVTTSMSGAHAADAILPEPSAPPAETVLEPGWSFTIAPYAWMAGLSGDVALSGYGKAHADVGFGDVFKSLDFVAMVVAEARYDRYALLSDFVYLMVTNKVKAPMGIKAKVDTDVLQWTPTLAYSLYLDDRANLDVVAGARLWSVETSLRTTAPVSLAYHADDQWIDAIGGIRGTFDLTENTFVHGWALAGAGGSDLVWDLLGGVGYRWNDKVSLMAGYRAQGVDYRNGAFEFDAVMKGPAISALLRF